MIQGANFVSLDNVRGKLDSPAIESFLTEDSFSAREPYSPIVEIDPRRVIVMMTSNKAEFTRDFANRSSAVRLLKQPPGHAFRQFEEGDLLDHVRAESEQYLGAVFAVVRAWHAAGKPRSDEYRHDFRAWARTLGWIVHDLLGAAPLLAGYDEAKERMANPALTWLRSVALAVVRVGRLGEPLRTHHLMDIIENEPDLEIPGVKEEDDVRDERSRQNALKAMGLRLKQCFRDSDFAEIDGYRIKRSEAADENYRMRPEYVFKKPEIPQSPAITRRDPRNPRGDSKTETAANGGESDEATASLSLTPPAGIAGAAGDHGGSDDWEEI